MKPEPRALPLPQLALLAAAAVLAWLAWPAASQDAVAHNVMPSYDGEGRLLLPEDYREWVFVGSSLGLSYSEGAGGMEMFHHTLMEPTAYAHFRRSGDFRQGTMLVLMLHGTGEGELPQRRGRFADDVHGVEMAVKDSRSFEDGWAYFGFGGMNGVRDRAAAFASDSCYRCHAEHGAHDNVFLQFYPLLREAAPAGSPARLAQATEPPPVGERASEASARAALRGLDPVILAEGREEMGKPEIVVEHGGHLYQFVSEPTRARFAADPERYSIQNETCPVVPGATPSADLFAVHQGRIFIFASSNCVDRFRADPASFLTEEASRASIPSIIP